MLYSFSKDESLVLATLFIHDIIGAHDIEKITDLRQPQVSIALRSLTDQGFVIIDSVLTRGYGRPRFLYKLKKSPEETIKRIDIYCESLYRVNRIKLSGLKEVINENYP